MTHDDRNAPVSPVSWETVDSCLVTMSIPGPVDKATWQAYIDDLRQPQLESVFSLVSGAATIDAVQRKQAANTVSERGLRVIVVTDNRLTRGVLTAISWLGASIRSYSWMEIERAFEGLAMDPEAERRIREIAEAFRRRHL